MVISFIRTIFLYLLVVFSFRVMGKRQIGELSPSELAVAIMISELASIPMQETNVPLLNGIIPILTLIILEIGLSFATLKSKKARDLFTGTPSILVHKGKIVQKEMEKLRFNVDDLLEELRLNNFPNISEVEFAILETNGQLSIIPKSEKKPLTPFDMNIAVSPSNLPYTIISDGKINNFNIEKSNKNLNWLKNTLEKNNIKDPKEVFFMNVSDDGSIFIQKYDKGGKNENL